MNYHLLWDNTTHKYFVSIDECNIRYFLFKFDRFGRFYFCKGTKSEERIKLLHIHIYFFIWIQASSKISTYINSFQYSWAFDQSNNFSLDPVFLFSCPFNKPNSHCSGFLSQGYCNAAGNLNRIGNDETKVLFTFYSVLKITLLFWNKEYANYFQSVYESGFKKGIMRN